MPSNGEIDADADPAAVAHRICLQALSRAPRTRATLADLLHRRGVPDDAAAAVLTRLAEVGLVDDQAYAQAWVSSRQRGRGLARRALASELRQRGVAAEVVDQAVAEVDDDLELATARSLVARRLSATASLPTEVRVRRLVGLLVRKGYPGGVAATVVRSLLTAQTSDCDGRR